jgi:hypothetical protein
MKHIITLVLFLVLASPSFGQKIVKKKAQTKYIWQEAVITK